ncbi:universal stress protein [Pontibacter vulgaris]|uniref:universal stress protein n=1 Tax=Pontibacter vulgaris TaxID=2905679 RepID=UPI001FA7FFC1|nr:universal stress protein [Pontibacter vulgaris]
MKRILVPTDFSEQAKNAFEVAIALARKTGASIKLLHVIEAPYAPTFSATGDTFTQDNMEQVYVLQLLESSRRQIADLAKTISHEGVDVVQEVDVDRVIGKIRRVIKEDQVDLVVMGSKGSSGFDEFLIGSNTEKVVRTAECPVLTVKRRHPSFDIKNIVLASDFKREIGAAIEKFKSIQALFEAKVHMVYINTPGAFESSSNVKNKMQKAAERYGLTNYTLNVYNDVMEEDGILHFAQDINADLIMMATHGRTGFAHLLSGSIAEDLVNHAAIPVLTFAIK